MNDDNPRILAVDDEAFNLKLLLLHLEKEGFSDVETASNRAEAIEAVQAAHLI